MAMLTWCACQGIFAKVPLLGAELVLTQKSIP